MAEIKSDKIDVSNLSPEERAELLADLNRERTPPILISAETNKAASEDQSARPETDQNIVVPSVAPVSKVIPPESPSQEISASENSKRKGLLNQLLHGKIKYEDVDVNASNAFETTDEVIGRKKAA